MLGLARDSARVTSNARRLIDNESVLHVSSLVHRPAGSPLWLQPRRLHQSLRCPVPTVCGLWISASIGNNPYRSRWLVAPHCACEMKRRRSRHERGMDRRGDRGHLGHIHVLHEGQAGHGLDGRRRRDPTAYLRARDRSGYRRAHASGEWIQQEEATSRLSATPVEDMVLRTYRRTITTHSPCQGGSGDIAGPRVCGRDAGHTDTPVPETSRWGDPFDAFLFCQVVPDRSCRRGRHRWGDARRPHPIPRSAP
jgi:hypothetical protein